MTKKQILDFAKKNKLMAVYVEWVDGEDWNNFRIERVSGQRIAFTGMADCEGNHHTGDFFWVHVSEIKQINLRI